MLLNPVERYMKEKGIKEGIKIAKLDTAGKLLDKGLSIDEIVEITGLTSGDILNIKQFFQFQRKKKRNVSSIEGQTYNDTTLTARDLPAITCFLNFKHMEVDDSGILAHAFKKR